MPSSDKPSHPNAPPSEQMKEPPERIAELERSPRGANERSPQPGTPVALQGLSFLLGIATRAILPVILLFIGVAGYNKFSAEKPEEATPRPEAKPIEARVHELKRQDYHILVVSATLSALLCSFGVFMCEGQLYLESSPHVCDMLTLPSAFL